MFTNSGIPGVFKKGRFYCEIISARLRCVDVYGMPYSAIASATIVNGVLHIEGFISKEPITKEDIADMNDICMELGFTYYIKSYFPIDDNGNVGERITERVELAV